MLFHRSPINSPLSLFFPGPTGSHPFKIPHDPDDKAFPESDILPDNPMRSVLEVFYRPGKVFESLPERKWAWVWPLILNMLLIVVMDWEYPHYMGAENFVRQSLGGSSQSSLTPEQLQTALARLSSPLSGYVGPAVSEIPILLIMSGLLMPLAMMTSRVPKFGTMFSMVSLAHFPFFFVLVASTTLVLIMSPDPAALDWRNVVPSNVAAFMNRNETSKTLYNLMESFDVLSVAGIGLMALGFSKITHSKFRVGLAAVLALWALYVIVKVSLAFAFGIYWI